MTRKVHWVPRSKDKKTGMVVASYSPKSTCPDSCTLKTGGCYAWGLFYINILGGKLERGAIKYASLKEAVSERLNSCRIVRHRIAGDVVGDVEQTLKECDEVVEAGLINIGYTHTWKEEASQPLKKWFRASCQTEEEVSEARGMGWATTLIVPPNSPKSKKLSNGEMAYLCPARHDVPGKQDITCNTCTLCKVNDHTRSKTVMFEVHGSTNTIKKASTKIK
jgi:hypothetical protein